MAWGARNLISTQVGVDYSLEGSTARASRALRAAQPAVLLGRLHFEKGGSFDRSVSVVVEVDQRAREIQLALYGL